MRGLFLAILYTIGPTLLSDFEPHLQRFNQNQAFRKKLYIGFILSAIVMPVLIACIIFFVMFITDLGLLSIMKIGVFANVIGSSLWHIILLFIIIHIIAGIALLINSVTNLKKEKDVNWGKVIFGVTFLILVVPFSFGTFVNFGAKMGIASTTVIYMFLVSLPIIILILGWFARCLIKKPINDARYGFYGYVALCILIGAIVMFVQKEDARWFDASGRPNFLVDSVTMELYCGLRKEGECNGGTGNTIIRLSREKAQEWLKNRDQKLPAKVARTPNPVKKRAVRPAAQNARQPVNLVPGDLNSILPPQRIAGGQSPGTYVVDSCGIHQIEIPAQGREVKFAVRNATAEYYPSGSIGVAVSGQGKKIFQNGQNITLPQLGDDRTVFVTPEGADNRFLKIVIRQKKS